jgi:hypothetical protein
MKESSKRTFESEAPFVESQNQEGCYVANPNPNKEKAKQEEIAW